MERGIAQNITWDYDNELFWKTLKISYDQLNEEHQDMFLDIAFFSSVSKKKHFVECIGMEMVH
jgi:hypothetical protein